MNFSGVRTIIFDLDGTLCRYGLSTAQAIAATLERVGLSPASLGDPDSVATRYIELWHEEEKVRSPQPFRERIWSRLLAEHGINEDGLAQVLGDTYISIRLPSLRLDPAAVPLLTALRPQYRLGLLTNGPGEMQWPKIERLSLEPYFDEIIVAGDVGIYKPDPKVFQIVLSRLNEVPSRALYVGDSYQMDVVGAKRAGLLSVWLNNSENNEPLDSVRPDAEIEQLFHLEGIL